MGASLINWHWWYNEINQEFLKNLLYFYNNKTYAYV